MKKLISVILSISAIPFILCSCINNNAELEEITLNHSDITMTVGDTDTLTVTLTPDNVETKNLTWNTSDKSIVTVDDGDIKAKTQGTATITVTAENGINDSCKVTVKNKDVSKITLNTTETSLKEGSKIQLIATITPSDAPTNTLEWTSSDESIAEVDSNGFVKGLKNGTAIITCKAESGANASCNITVKGSSVESTTQSDDDVSRETTVPTTTTANSSSSVASGKFHTIFAASSTEKLSENDVKNLSSDEAQQAINEIYARNGYQFKDAELREYFESQSWYKANPSFSEDDFNSIEKYNINLLKKYR
jgi:hypothetical protein